MSQDEKEVGVTKKKIFWVPVAAGKLASKIHELHSLKNPPQEALIPLFTS